MTVTLSAGTFAEPFILRVTDRDEGRFDLRVDGRLPVDWAVRLTGWLSEIGVDLRAGEARRGVDGSWTVTLHCHGDAPDVVGIRAGLTHEPRRGAVSFPMLTSYSLSPPSATHPARLEVFAHDAIGFFGDLLRSLAMHGVFARSFELSTERGIVNDVLTLSSLGMSALSPGGRANLVKALARATSV